MEFEQRAAEGALQPLVRKNTSPVYASTGGRFASRLFIFRGVAKFRENEPLAIHREDLMNHELDPSQYSWPDATARVVGSSVHE